MGGLPEVREAAMIGVAVHEWARRSVALVMLERSAAAGPEVLRAAANAKLGKIQRSSGLSTVNSLPRSANGKVLKRELQEFHSGGPW